MTTYETRLRGARNRIAEAATLVSDEVTKEKLASIARDITALIQAVAPINASEELL